MIYARRLAICIIVSFSRLFVISKIFLFLKKNYPSFFNEIIHSLNYEQVKKLSYVKEFRRISEDDLNKFKIKEIKNETFEKIKSVRVYDLSEEYYLKVKSREINFFKFSDAAISPNSDLIRLGDEVFFKKDKHPESIQEIFLDEDILKINENGLILASTAFKERKHSIGLNLCGVGSNSWSHFIACIFPKIISFVSLEIKDPLKIFIPDSLDENCIDLLNTALLETDALHEITKLKSEEIVHCEILYHFDSFSFVANHSEISSPYFIVIPEITRNLLGNFFKKYFYNSERRKSKKIYIGRNSFRDLINRSEIRDFFIQQGFEEVFPHQLSIAEKADLFGSASHIVGPGSSALTNLLFSFGKTKILTFINFARAQDTFFGSLTDSESYDHDLTFLLGKEKISSDLNNSYQIDKQTIESVVKNTNFF